MPVRPKSWSVGASLWSNLGSPGSVLRHIQRNWRDRFRVRPSSVCGPEEDGQVLANHFSSRPRVPTKCVRAGGLVIVFSVLERQ
jgi:hypothetical protein